jgi:hypothetical protein
MSDPDKEGDKRNNVARNGENTASNTPSRPWLAPPWQPGQSGNPAGRPKGSKNEFVEDFWRDLRDAWKAHGRDALKRVIETMPDKFIAVAAGKIPAEIEHTSNTYVIVAPEASTSTQEWLDSLSVRRPDQTIQ